jgi:hypothetical protein
LREPVVAEGVVKYCQRGAAHPGTRRWIFEETAMQQVVKPMSRLVVLVLFLVGTIATVPQANAEPYPQPIVTTTVLYVRSSTMWGVGARATARVSSDAGTPTGSVRFSVDGKVRATVALVNGVAHWRTSRGIWVGWHHMRARYVPTSGSNFNPSASTVKSFRIVKARTRTTVNAPNIRKGHRPSATAAVTSPNGRRPGGYVVFRLFKGTHLLATKRVVCSFGKAAVRFGNVVRRAGSYSVRGRFRGNTHYRTSVDSDGFSVR